SSGNDPQIPRRLNKPPAARTDRLRPDRRLHGTGGAIPLPGAGLRPLGMPPEGSHHVRPPAMPGPRGTPRPRVHEETPWDAGSVNGLRVGSVGFGPIKGFGVAFRVPGYDNKNPP